MTSHENIIRLPPNKRSTTINILIDQGALDGLNALIHWLDGFQEGKGRIPGAHDLVMHYRNLGQGVAKLKAEDKKQEEPPYQC